MNPAKILFNNFGWKLTSLILATLTWVLVKEYSSQSAKAAQGDVRLMTSRIELEPKILSTPDDPVAYLLVPSVCSVRIQMDEGEAGRANLSDLRLFVDIPPQSRGRDSVQSVRAYWPGGLVKVEIDPPAVLVQPMRVPETISPSNANTGESF
jgi:hypothetical protein